MSSKSCEKLLILEKRRRELLEELFSITEMVQGSFCLIYVKCGRASCRCNRGQLHPHYRMSMRREGKQLSRAVPKEERTWITEATDNYRRYRRIMKAIKVVEAQIGELLKRHEIELIRKSSKNKRYLPTKLKESETKSEKRSEKVKKSPRKN